MSMILLMVTSRNTEPLAVAKSDYRNYLVSQRQACFVACRRLQATVLCSPAIRQTHRTVGGSQRRESQLSSITATSLFRCLSSPTGDGSV